MLRTLIIVLLVYLALKALFRILSAYFFPRQQRSGRVDGDSGVGDDLLVEDPYCKVHLPKQEAIVVRDNDGRPLYFCSQKCRDAYLAQTKRSA